MVLPFFRHCQDGEHRLFSYTGFGSMKIIGLMSGTSADGVDATLVEIKKRESRISVKLVAFNSVAFSKKLQTHILKVCESGTGGEVCDLNVLLGEKFSKAALKLIDLSGLSPNNIHLIGSHGQTLYHHPHPPHTIYLANRRTFSYCRKNWDYNYCRLSSTRYGSRWRRSTTDPIHSSSIISA